MKCSKCESLYTKYKDGELSAKSEDELKEHLAGCRVCSSLYARLDRIIEASSSLPRFSVSEGTAERILTRIRSSETVTVAPVRLSRWLAPRLAYGALAMAAVAVLSFTLFYRSGRRTSVIATEAPPRERIYSLGPVVESTEFVADEPDYSLGHTTSSDDTVYSLPSLPVYARPASY